MVQSLITTFMNFQIAFRDSEGYPMGIDSTPDAVTNGTSTNAYFYDKPVEIAGVTIERPTVSGRGGGKTWIRRVASVSEPSNAALTLSGKDTTFDAFIVGTLVDTTTNSNMEIVPRNSRKVTVPPFIAMATAKLAVGNVDKYLHRIFLNCQLNLATDPGSSQATGENPNNIIYEIVPDYSSRLAWGENIVDNANLDIADDLDFQIEIISDYPLTFSTYVDDGTGTTDAFTLGYIPATVDKTFALIFNEGADDASNVAIAADGDVTLTAANTAGDKMVIFYPIPESPTATA